MKRIYWALLISLMLHSTLFLVRCDLSSTPPKPEDDILIHIQSEDIPERVIEAPAPVPPPPPPPPAKKISAERRPAEESAEIAPTGDSIPEAAQSETIADAPAPSPQEQKAPSATLVTQSGSGDSHTPVNAEVLDNTDFKPFGNLKPSYPDAARRLGIEGKVTLRLLINAQGRVDSVLVIEWKGHPGFAENAMRVARAWRFAPPRYQGKPASAWYTRTIEFRLLEN